MSDEIKTRFNLTIKRFIPAPINAVFQLWTDPDLLIKWWGPPGVTCTEAMIDARAGGSYRIANLLPTGTTLWIYGEFLTVDPPALLRYTWGIEPNVADETVTVTFVPVGEGTEVTVFHENAPDVASRDSHENGWDGCLEKLVVVASY